MAAIAQQLFIEDKKNHQSMVVKVVADASKQIKVIQELDFAISAGDREFSPAVKLVLTEALALINNAHNYTLHSFESAFNAITSTYGTLLAMQARNPVAKQMQQRFNRRYADFTALIQQSRIENVQRPYEIVASDGNVSKNAYFLAKRLFDIVLATVLLVVLLPLLLVVMVLIRLDSPGSIFFTQKRMGSARIYRHGITVWQPVVFDFYKFRSMFQNADESYHREYIAKWMNGKLDGDQESQKVLKLQNDPRITRIGYFIRKTSIDELPQLLNVIKGDMSLVGPRPVPLYEAEAYSKEHAERLASVPGITGLWQVEGRGRTTLEEQVRLDVDYINHQSLLQDILILVRTPAAVFKGTGAH